MGITRLHVVQTLATVDRITVSCLGYSNMAEWVEDRFLMVHLSFISNWMRWKDVRTREGGKGGKVAFHVCLDDNATRYGLIITCHVV